MPSDHGGGNGKTATVIGDASYDSAAFRRGSCAPKGHALGVGRGSRVQTNSERKVKRLRNAWLRSFRPSQPSDRTAQNLDPKRESNPLDVLTAGAGIQPHRSLARIELPNKGSGVGVPRP